MLKRTTLIKVESSDLAEYTDYANGILFVWGDITGGGCWSALGQISGFTGGLGSITQWNAPSWVVKISYSGYGNKLKKNQNLMIFKKSQIMQKMTITRIWKLVTANCRNIILNLDIFKQISKFWDFKPVLIFFHFVILKNIKIMRFSIYVFCHFSKLPKEYLAYPLKISKLDKNRFLKISFLIWQNLKKKLTV